MVLGNIMENNRKGRLFIPYDLHNFRFKAIFLLVFLAALVRNMAGSFFVLGLLAVLFEETPKSFFVNRRLGY